MTLDRSWSNSKGINGYCASRLSLKTKKTDIRQPKTIRQTTFGESQGKVVPPKFRPSRGMIVRPTMEMLPNQSIALRPSEIAVFGLWTSKKRRMRTKASAEHGRLIQKIQGHETSWVKTPPRIGPIPPASAQMNSQRPR